jgi:hypothetical protein
MPSQGGEPIQTLHHEAAAEVPRSPLGKHRLAWPAAALAIVAASLAAWLGVVLLARAVRALF